MEEAANMYIAAIREMQPEGPYFLGGYSFGSLIAFEMACQLLSMGQEVSLLAILDGPAPNSNLVADENDAKRLAILATEATRGYTDRSFEDLYAELRQVNEQELLSYTARYVSGIRIDISPPPTWEDWMHWITRELENFTMRVDAARKYQPKEAYHGNIVLFRTPEMRVYYGDDLGWRKYSTTLPEIHEIQGFHDTIVNEPSVQILAEKLKSYLSKTS